MAVIQVDTAEISDVLDVLQERGVEYAISIESDGAFLYGSQGIVDQVDDILWARGVIQEPGVGYAISMQNR